MRYQLLIPLLVKKCQQLESSNHEMKSHINTLYEKMSLLEQNVNRHS